MKSAAMFVGGVLFGAVLAFALFHPWRYQIQVIRGPEGRDSMVFQACILDSWTGQFYYQNPAGSMKFNPVTGERFVVEMGEKAKPGKGGR